MWFGEQTEINEKWQHQERKEWMEKLQVELKKALREGFPSVWTKAMDKWGVQKLHNELYRLCCMCARAGAEHVSMSINTRN